MTFQVWLAFFVATTVTAIAPGSGVILCMSHGLTHGMRRTSVTIVGMEIGMTAILFTGVDDLVERLRELGLPA